MCAEEIMPVTTIDYYTITVDEDLYQWPVSECAKTLIGIGRFLLSKGETKP